LGAPGSEYDGFKTYEWVEKSGDEKTYIEQVMEPVLEESESTGPAGGSREQRQRDEAAQEDAVFLRSYIPRTLNEVYDPERDVDRLTRGEGKDLIYAGVTGIVKVHEENDEQGQNQEKKVVKFEDAEDSRVDMEEGGEGEEDGSDSEDGDEDKEGGEFVERKPRGHRHEDKEAKKERKKAAKEGAREKRKSKIPKAEKKRRIKVTSSK